jgi:GTP cyclohydrolase I
MVKHEMIGKILLQCSNAYAINLPVDKTKIQNGIKMLLDGLGEDVSRDGLVDTPRRVSEMLERFTRASAIGDVEILNAAFNVEKYDEFVLVKDIKFSSFCEHHLLPFFGSVSVCYIPSGGTVIGLSKLARIVAKYSRRLQLQERMTRQIADAISMHTENAGVLVFASAHHMCMGMRGVCQPTCSTVTCAKTGEFSSNRALVAQVQQIILAKSAQ